jgi:hypothetical protein
MFNLLSATWCSLFVNHFNACAALEIPKDEGSGRLVLLDRVTALLWLARLVGRVSNVAMIQVSYKGLRYS